MLVKRNWRKSRIIFLRENEHLIVEVLSLKMRLDSTQATQINAKRKLATFTSGR